MTAIKTVGGAAWLLMIAGGASASSTALPQTQSGRGDVAAPADDAS